jgi:hypothetical protein
MLRKVEAALQRTAARPLDQVLYDVRVKADVAHELVNDNLEKLLLHTIDHLARLKAVEEAMIPRGSRSR